jgi:uncharacterized protein involved in outer membrane biogenesis
VNSLLLSLTALLILVLSALFAAPLFVDWNDYRHVFETQAAKLLGREVKVDGKVHLVLLPAPELRFDNVRVADEEGRLERPFLEARSIEAWLKIGALLSGTVEARKIAIVDPVLRLNLKADGTGNWSDVGRPGVALPFAPKDVLLDSVSVSGGKIEITDEGTERLTLDAVDGELSAASLSGPYKVSATYDFQGRRQELRFSTGEADAAGLFRLKAALRDPERGTNYSLDGAMTEFSGRPSYDGNFTMRVAGDSSSTPYPAMTDTAEAESGEQIGQAAKPKDDLSFVELKGPLKATPDRAELSEFDLTIHAKGRPQIFKGNLALDLGDPFKARAELAARFTDLDILFGTPGAERPLSPAALLYLVAEDVLGQAAGLGEGTLAVSIEQASLGGDLVGRVDLALAAREGAVTIERLNATLPGDNRIEVSGQLAQGAIGPIFTGPIKLEGTGLRTLTRWAAGDRDISGQTSIGDFAFQANATIGDGELKLADVQGEVSDTTFRGALNYRAGERNLIELSLDSDRLDLREMIGEGPIWRSWLPAASGTETAPEVSAPNLLAQFRGHDARVTLNVDELLLPHVSAGKLDARFTVQDDTLEVERLDFAAADEVVLNGKGRIQSVSEAPSGRVDFALKATTTDGLRIASELFGLPEDVSKSEHLSVLAPLDVRGSLIADREGEATRDEATKAALELGGQAGGSDIAFVARATGAPGRLSEAEIDISGSVTGERPQALLVLLFPDLPQERFAKAGGTQGTLSLKLKGVPKTRVAGRAGLETASMQLAFEGHGALQDEGVALTGKVSASTQDAGLALMLAGFEAPPSAAGVPLTLKVDLVKQGDSLDLTPVKATVDGETIEGSANFSLDGDKTRFKLHANAGTVSLPSLLGTLVAWQRVPSTEEMLGAVGGPGASDVWPSRGFSLGPIEMSEGEIALQAKTLSLGAPFQVSDATLVAHVGQKGLAVTDLKGGLFGGTLAASGSLAPRGAGAALEAQAEIKGGKLEDLSKKIAGKGLAKGPFDLRLTVQGEGLSPPGLVAGLSGEGRLALGAGSVQALSPEPLRRVAVTASKKIKANQEQVAAEARAVREKITAGRYPYTPADFTFEVKNGTLRFAPATLAGVGAETKVNAYVELASLKLDSEWVMSLAGAKNKDVPPVSLVFAGPLNDAGQISPAIDTAAIESYLTMRRLQEGVESLETLDVTGRTPLPQPDDDTADESRLDAPRPTAHTHMPNLPRLQSAPASPAAETLPSTEAMTMPIPSTAPEEIAAPAMPAAPLQAVSREAAEPETPAAAPETVEPEAPAAAPAALATPTPTEAVEPEPPAAAPAALATPAPSETVEPKTPGEAGAPLLATVPAEVEAVEPEPPAATPETLPETVPTETAESEQPETPSEETSAEHRAAPAAEDQPAPVAEDQAAPVTEDQVTPVAEDQATPVTEDQATPGTEDQATPVAEEAPAESREPSRPRRHKPREAPDSWKKGISVFGG